MKFLKSIQSLWMYLFSHQYWLKLKAWDSFRESALQVVMVTKSHLAAQIYGFVDEASVVVVRKENAIKSILKSRGVIPVMTVSNESDCPPALWKFFSGDQLGGCAVRSMGNFITLVFSDKQSMSTPWKGLLVLHEFYHAFLYHQSEEKIFARPEIESAKEELIIYTFECELAGLYFGEMYMHIIETQADKLYKQGGLTPGKRGEVVLTVNMDWVDQLLESLEYIIGIPLSEFERATHKKVIFIHVYLTMIRKRIKQGAENMCLQFVLRECVVRYNDTF